MRVAPAIELTEEERKTLTKYSRGRNMPAKIVLRAMVVLRAAEGAVPSADLPAFSYAASSINSSFDAFGFSGLSHTSSIGAQFLVSPLQRCG